MASPSPAPARMLTMVEADETERRDTERAEKKKKRKHRRDDGDERGEHKKERRHDDRNDHKGTRSRRRRSDRGQAPFESPAPATNSTATIADMVPFGVAEVNDTLLDHVKDENAAAGTPSIFLGVGMPRTPEVPNGQSQPPTVSLGGPEAAPTPSCRRGRLFASTTRRLLPTPMLLMQSLVHLRSQL